MIFEVEAGGRKRAVEITGAGEAYRAVVDGRVYAVDVAKVGDVWSLLVGSAEPVPTPVRRAGRSYEVMIGDQAGDELTVYVNRSAVPVSFQGFTGPRAQRRAARADRTGDTQGGPVNLVAPMPGRIVNVLVREGDPVAARQGVVIVEAMKMENEVRAPRAGTVKEVRVTQGALVEARTVLVVID